MKNLGIDIDLVVANASIKWDKWLQEKSNVTESMLPTGEAEYAAHKHYPTFPKELCPISFWNSDTLYDEGVPLIPNSKEVITDLSNNYSIIFLTLVTGNHYESKYNYIKRHFSHIDYHFIAVGSHSKHLVNLDYMIDDRACNLVGFDDSVDTILFDSKFKQTTANDYVPMDWLSIQQYLRKKV